MKKLRIFFIAYTLLISCWALAQSDMRIVAKIKGVPITNEVVNKFIENTMLTDPIKIVLFSIAGSNWEQYQFEKKKWLERQFDQGLRIFSYLVVAQSMAMSEVNFSGGDFLNVPVKDFLSAIQSRENEVLKKYLETGRGIQWAREQYGQYLIENKFPKTEVQSALNVYWDWYHNEELRIGEQIRINHTLRWLVEKSSATQKELFNKDLFFEFTPFIQKTRSEIELTFAQVKNFSQVQVIMKKNPHFSTLIEDIEVKNPGQISIIDLSTVVPEFVDSAQKYFKDYFAKEFSKTLWEREKKIFEFLDRYHDAGILRQYARQNMDEFFSDSGDERKLILANLLSLAALAKEHKQKSSIKTEFQPVVQKIIDSLVFSMDHFKDFALKSKQLDFESALIAQSRNILEAEKSISINPFKKEFAQFTIALIRLEIKKFISNSVTPVKVKLIANNDARLYSRVRKHLESKQLLQGITNFNENEVQWSANENLVIFPTVDKQITRTQVWNFLINNNPIYQKLLNLEVDL